jgi:hypothetical protein
MASSGILRRVALARTDVSEELSVPFIRVKRIGELGTTLAVTSNRRALRASPRLPHVSLRETACFDQHGHHQVFKTVVDDDYCASATAPVSLCADRSAHSQLSAETGSANGRRARVARRDRRTGVVVLDIRSSPV